MGTAVLADVMGLATRHAPAATSFSGTLTWAVVLPLTVAAALGIAGWNALHGARARLLLTGGWLLVHHHIRRWRTRRHRSATAVAPAPIAASD